jgi:hypothetical protein
MLLHPLEALNALHLPNKRSIYFALAPLYTERETAVKVKLSLCLIN